MRMQVLWVVLIASVARMPPTACEEVDCREVSGYTSGPVPHTCTVQLPLNDTESEIISSLRAEYEAFPVKCRFGKQTNQYSWLIILVCFNRGIRG